jgi:uncharacterized protein (TIGR03083 family)
MAYYEVQALMDQLQDLRALVSDLSDEEFDLPTRCPGWTVAELIAHLEAILLSLVSENTKPMEGKPEIDRYDVYRRNTDEKYPYTEEMSSPEATTTVAEMVRDRSKVYAAGRRPGQVRAAFQFVVDGAISALPRTPEDRVVRRPPRYPRMTYRELVASRQVEFGIHTLDIAHATGRPEILQPAAAAIITDTLDVMLGEKPPAALGWDATHYILVGSGRQELAPAERQALGALADRFPLFR